MSTASQELIQAWLLFPVVFIVSSACLGIAVFSLSRLDLRNPVILPTGFSALVVLGQLTTISPMLAPRTPAIFIVVIAICGIYFWSEILCWFRSNLTPLVLGLAVFYIHGLPILMSGTPTFAGWIKLDDGSSWLAMTDQMLTAGRDTSSLAPSTHEAISQILLNPATEDLPYPSGSFVPLGVFSKWLSIDPAWILQPYMAAAAMLLCITFFALLQQIKIPNWTKFLAVVLGPTSALYLGYAMWGGIKELLLVPLIVLVTALTPNVLEKTNEPTRVIPFALGCSAYVLIFSLSGLVWLAIPILYLVFKLTMETRKVPWRHAAYFIATFSICSLAVLSSIANSPKSLMKMLTFAQSSSDIGNLLGPLKFTQIFGVWLTGDFRYPPQFPVANTALVLLAGVLFVFGCYFFLTTGNGHIAALGIWVTVLSAIALKGNAWISGKTLAMASPIVLVIAFCALGFVANKFSMEAGILAAILTGGVLVSYAYTYHEAWLAPYDQLKELEVIGKDSSFSSPALMIEYSAYGSRHFLRKLDAEGAGELRRNLIPLRDGKGLGKGAFADIDEFALDSIEKYQTLVLRSSPNSSRPPGNYDLKFIGTYYEVWQKNLEVKLPALHFPFGSKGTPSAKPECSFIDSEIAKTLSGNDVAVSPSRSFINLPIGDITNQASGPGKASVFESKFDVSDANRFDLWVEGWIKGRAKVLIDDVLVTSVSHVLNVGGSLTKIGAIDLQSGPHVLRVVMDSPWFIPGSGGLSYPMGPFYLSGQNEKYSVEEVSPKNLNSLCTKPVDWIELVPR